MRMLRWRRGHDPLVCREFVELVSDYIEGTMPAEERARFEAHLAECDGCAGYLEDVGRMITSMHAIPAPPPDAATREVLQRALRELRGPP